MFLWQLLFAILVALLVAPLIAIGFRRTGSAMMFAVFFAIVLLAAWAGGLWVVPFGPAVGGVYILPVVLTGLLVGLLFAAAAPPVPPARSRREAVREVEEEVAAEETLNVFFWMILALLIAIVIAGYLSPRPGF